VKIVVVSTLSSFRCLHQEWNELLDASEERDNVFLRHEILDVWFSSFGASKLMYVITCYDNGQIQGAAPLMIVSDRYKYLAYRRLGYIEDANMPSLNIICRNGRELEVIQSVVRHLVCEIPALWDAAVLNKMPISSNTLSSLTTCLAACRIRHFIRKSMNSPFIKTVGSYDAFLKTTTPKFRKQLRSKLNRLDREGKVDIATYHKVGDQERHLLEVFSVSARSWKHSVNTSMTGTLEREQFYRALSHVAEKNGWLRLWILRLKDQPIAMEYHLEYAGITHAMRGDYDRAFEHLAPGSVLEAQIIKHCFLTSTKEYDFCGLPYEYKTRWTNMLHERVCICFYPKKPYSLFLYFIQRYAPIARRIATNILKYPGDTMVPRKAFLSKLASQRTGENWG